MAFSQIYFIVDFLLRRGFQILKFTTVKMHESNQLNQFPIGIESISWTVFLNYTKKNIQIDVKGQRARTVLVNITAIAYLALPATVGYKTHTLAL